MFAGSAVPPLKNCAICHGIIVLLVDIRNMAFGNINTFLNIPKVRFWQLFRNIFERSGGFDGFSADRVDIGVWVAPGDIEDVIRGDMMPLK